MKTKFKKLKPPFKKKTTDNDKDQYQNADLEAAKPAPKPDKGKAKGKAVEFPSQAEAPRIAKVTDKAVNRRSEIPVSLLDAEYAKYLGQEETNFQKGPALKGSVEGNGSYHSRAPNRPPYRPQPRSQPSSSTLQFPQSHVGPIRHNSGPRQPLVRVDSGVPQARYRSTYLEQSREINERIAEVNENTKRFTHATRKFNTGERLTTYGADRLHSQTYV